MTDLKTSLIEEMESVKNSAPTHPRGVGYNEGLDTAIEIIRNHQPVQVAPTTLEVLRQAREALSSCYDVEYHPADGSTKQDAAITAIDKVLGEDKS